MKNQAVQGVLMDCKRDLQRVKALHDGAGATSDVAPYLTRYALVRACGAVEVAFKAAVVDFCSASAIAQLRYYINNQVRRSSRNPTYSAICEFLGQFDAGWKDSFKMAMDSRSDKSILISALNSLVEARNDFAHGGSPTITMGDVLLYYEHACKVIEELDSAIV